MKKLITGGILVLALFLSGASPYNNQFINKRNDAAATVHQMTDSSVEVACSVVMIAPERALTARHCLQMESPVVTIDGVNYPVTFGYGNPVLDLAILTIPDAPCPCAKPTDNKLQVGEQVMLIGFPYSIAKVVTYGEMQARVVLDAVEYAVVTAPARPGNSGGGVFNEQGELIGIVSMADITGYITFIVEIEPLLSPIKITEHNLDEANSFHN